MVAQPSHFLFCPHHWFYLPLQYSPPPFLSFFFSLSFYYTGNVSELASKKNHFNTEICRVALTAFSAFMRGDEAGLSFISLSLLESEICD